MSPALEAPPAMPVAEAVRITRRLVEDANGCRLLLREEEVRAIEALVAFCIGVRVA